MEMKWRIKQKIGEAAIIANKIILPKGLASFCQNTFGEKIGIMNGL
jgi:hypothetical protein